MFRLMVGVEGCMCEGRGRRRHTLPSWMLAKYMTGGRDCGIEKKFVKGCGVEMRV